MKSNIGFVKVRKFHYFFNLDFKKLLFFVFLVNSTSFAANQVCGHLFTEQVEVSEAFKQAIRGNQQSSFKLLINLENEFNRSEYARKSEQVELPMVRLKDSQLQVDVNTDKQNEKELIQQLMFAKKGSAFWYQHPFNQDSSVPYLYNKKVNSLIGYLSASRSIFFQQGENFYSIRTPTDHPRGLNQVADLNKSNIGPELDNAKWMMNVINTLEGLNFLNSEVSIAKEIAIVKTTDPLRNSGFMIRSLDFLNRPNRYYLPAFSLEQIGEEIAKKHGQKFSKFWQQHYAEALARAQVHLLLQYGLQMDFPHGQNILLETDLNFKPTGHFVFRDIDDMSQNLVVTNAINSYLKSKQKKLIQVNRGQGNHRLNLEYLWDRFVKRAVSRTDNPEIYSEEINQIWYNAYIKSYIKELAKILGIKKSDIGNSANDIDVFLNSTWGQDVLNYFYQSS